jgi:hypothetical protein
LEINVEKTKVLRISKQPSPKQRKMDQKQQQNVEYFVYLDGMITKAASCTRDIKYRTDMAKAAISKNKAL